MKKNLLSFVVFVLAYLGSIGFIYYKANPTTIIMAEQEPLEWHGRVENEYGTYDGTLIGDLFNGDGSFRFMSGETYVGDWQDSYMDGNGVMLFPDIGKYKGELSYSMRNGYGTFIWITGEKYYGFWENDEMSGLGTYVFSSGAKIEGEFQKNKPVSGILRYEDKASEDDPDTKIISLKYTFSKSKREIVFSTKGGLKYDGDASGLFTSGSATITYPSGNTYKGQILEGLRDGDGEYKWIDSSGKVLSFYEGKWSANHMNGAGEYHFSNSQYPYLSGKFKNDVPSGTSVYYKAEGNTFETKWKKGKCVSIKET